MQRMRMKLETRLLDEMLLYDEYDQTRICLGKLMRDYDNYVRVSRAVKVLSLDSPYQRVKTAAKKLLAAYEKGAYYDTEFVH